MNRFEGSPASFVGGMASSWQPGEIQVSKVPQKNVIAVAAHSKAEGPTVVLQTPVDGIADLHGTIGEPREVTLGGETHSVGAFGLHIIMVDGPK